ESASVLLERIKAEKERLIKEGKIKKSKKSAKTSDTPHYEQVLFEVPEGWESVPVSELFCLNPKSEISDDTGVGFIPMTCVDDGFSGNHSFEERIWKEVKKGYCHFQNGDIGVAKISPCFENLKSTIFQNLPNNYGAGTTELVILRPINVCAKFYLYLFKSKWYIDEGTKYFKGVVGQQRVHKGIFTDLQIPLPPLAEQQRIITEIERWFSLIDIIENDKDNLQATIKQAKSKILDLAIHGKLIPQDPNDEPAIDLLKRINPDFTPCDNGHDKKLPQNWTWVKGTNIFLPMKSTKPKDEQFQYIDIDSIDNKRQIISEVKTLKTSNAPSRATRYTQKNDVIFSMVRPYLRNIAKVNKDNYIASTGFYVCSPNPRLLYSDYCFYLMISDYVVNGLNQFMKGDNSPSINKRHIDKWLFPLPPLAEQHRIVQRIEVLFSHLDKIQTALEV
ncbi:restriction endonuclease subunit S, partial [Phocaeicola sp.]|uniref:restriction endonuclease subunit S n=1 Tax=Phocaeicola sp. TaxID=2773926 RepID=UPI003AAB1837